jgi:hypothetical protein
MNGLQAITALAKYIKQNLTLEDVAVFKSQKIAAYSGNYIVVNSLPFTTAFARNTVNVNVHAPQLSTGEVDTETLQKILAEVERIIPIDDDSEENLEQQLVLDNCYFARYCDSNAMQDTDKTYFINVKVKVTNYYGN